jgi:hypothetical protein
MAENIKVNIEQANEALSDLKKAIETFEPYTGSFLKNSSDKFKGFNSDFIESYKRLFDVLRNDSGKKLIANLNEYHTKMAESFRGIEELDEEISSKMEE